MASRGVCRRVLKPRMRMGRFLGEIATAANRTREIRPSGMRRGLNRNVGHGDTVNPPHISKECVSETLRLRSRALFFYPTEQPTRLRSSR